MEIVSGDSLFGIITPKIDNFIEIAISVKTAHKYLDIADFGLFTM